MLKSERFPKNCLQEKNKKHSVCETMSKEIDIVRGRILELVELVYGPDVLKATEVKAPCLDCVDGTNEEDESINLFSDLIGSIWEHS